MDIEKRIDPEILELFRALPEVQDITVGTDLIRQYLANFYVTNNSKFPVNKNVIVENSEIPGDDNQPAVPVRIYSRAEAKQARPALLWMHGGGFIVGNLDADDVWCRRIADDVGCVVVSVDYRLSPENPYPAGVQDCYAALACIVSNPAEYKFDGKRVGIGGVSAGANMAAAVSLMARDRKGPELAFQFLVCPCLDDRHKTYSSQAVKDKRIWHHDMSTKAWQAYLGNGYKDAVPAYAAPSRAQGLAGLPPTYLAAAELDLLRDEGVAYANRLMQAGVRTELHVFPRVPHGFEFYFRDAAISKRARSEYLSVLKGFFRLQ